MNTLWSSDLSWDTRVVYIQRQQRWWNAWLAATETELYGFADSQEEATRAMNRAIRQAEASPRPTTVQHDRRPERQR